MRFGRRFPSTRSILLLVLGIVLLLAVDGDRGQSGRGNARDKAPRRVQTPVVRVVDGDTARVRIGGREESVRYIGIDTPESAIPGERPECFGKRAAALNERLVEGKRVGLVFGAERRDHYGRLLVYVYRRSRLVNALIVRRGYARTLAIAPNTDLAHRFAHLQRSAATAGRGLWGAC